MKRFILFVLLVAASGPAFGAFTLTGTVRNEAGQGLANVDIDLIDACSGDNVFLVNDKTAPDGSYSITVNAGTYDVHYTPPAGSTVAASERENVAINANTNLGLTVLHPGRLVSGTVRNTSAAGIAGVDFKFVEVATGTHVFMGKDVTNSTGTYSLRVPPGTYDLEYRPPAGTTYVTVRRTNLVVQSDITGLLDTLVAGLNVFGVVKDGAGGLVKNVDLNFYDSCTGEKIATANDNTDALGKFSTYVPAGTYSIHFNPPRCKALASDRLADVKIDRATDLKTIVLSPAVLVSGRVLDGAAQALPRAKLKFYVAANGTRQSATDDDSDASGNFSIYLPTGTYNANVEPPSSRDLLVQRLSGVAVTGPTALGDIALAAGVPVTGLVLGPGDLPVRNVDIDADDTAAQAAVRLAHDSTAIDGTFRVVVPLGNYDFRYTAPACTGDAPDQQLGLAVTSSLTALPTMRLVAGVRARGKVVDPVGAAVVNADLDFFTPATRDKFFTPGDNTKNDGTYDVTVKPNACDIDYVPPAGAALRPTQRFGVSLFADTNLPDTTLATGYLVSGFVKAEATGLAAADVRLDFLVSGAPTALWTPHNNSALDGGYNVSVDAGTWDILYTPPVGSGLAPKWRRGVSVPSANVALPDTLLPPLTVPAVLSVSPASGSTAGGHSITVTGSGFQTDAALRLGGVTAASVVVVSATQITAVTPAHPTGSVDVTVVNPGNQPGTLARGYAFAEPATPVRLTVTKSGSDVVLSWPSTGQGSYTVFRSVSPSSFSDSSILGKTTSTTYTDAAGSAVPGLQFYQVN